MGFSRNYTRGTHLFDFSERLKLQGMINCYADKIMIIIFNNKRWNIIRMICFKIRVLGRKLFI